LPESLRGLPESVRGLPEPGFPPDGGRPEPDLGAPDEGRLPESERGLPESERALPDEGRPPDDGFPEPPRGRSPLLAEDITLDPLRKTT